MPEINLPEIVAEIFRKNDCSFMTLKHLVFCMSTQTKRDLKIFELTSAVEMQKILEPMIDNKYVFKRKGTVIYVLEPRDPEYFVLSILSATKGKGPKAIGRSVPFTKKECSRLLTELAKEGKIKVVLDDTLETRVYLTGNAAVAPETPKQAPTPQPKPQQEYTLERFKAAFDSLDKGRIFVRICDLRRTLNWPREIFDKALIQLRNAGIIQLHVGDASLMTPEDIRDCFIDENNFRMGTVTWHGR
ncbi:MAG: hypothetical protein IJS40_03115 [Synergistaceae bacterium]|nr:hypothetical protein [Synergistaceae bacterium]